jgi:hypothetical protein
MYTHYSFVAEVARQRQADYAAQAAVWRRYRALRRGGWWRRPFANRRPVFAASGGVSARRSRVSS